MSWSERFVRDHKQQTDRAIHRAFVQLASEPSTFKRFHEILDCARRRAPRLLEAPVFNGRHPGVDALANLSRFRGAYLRPAVDWAGTTSSWHAAVSELAHHLICEYRVPTFLASSWYAADQAADRKRGWFVAHSRGASFRSLNLPIVMTRRMESLFLASQDHLSIEYAIRRSELLALGASGEFVEAVMATRSATDLRDSEFWRTVWIFLIANARDVQTTQIGPMIDYIHAVRQDSLAVDPPAETSGFKAPQPAFSMKGRTVQSMLRLMQDWHRSLGRGSATFAWGKSPFEPLSVEEPPRADLDLPPRRWQMMELTDSAQLRSEGAALHHCVASYADRCYRGVSSIWSLRLWEGETVRHVLTVEVDSARRTIIQARGRANRSASGRSLRLLQGWAAREKLRMVV